MRIMVLSDLWLPFPGGAERLMFNLARDLDRREHDVYVLTGYHAAQAFDGAGVTIAALGVRDDREQGLDDVLGFVGVVEPDVIVTHHFYASQFGADLVATGIPVVHVVLNGARLEGCAFAVYITSWVAKHCGGLGTDMVVMPPAFGDVVADTHGDAIGFVKPLEHKGAETVYEIAARLPDRQFVVLRGEWQGIELLTDLPNVEYLEPVDDMRDFYARCRLLLMPSRSEDAGTVAQEATLNGLPCISSDVEGLVETNGGGIRLDPYDVSAWVTTIEALDDADVYAAIVRSQRAHFDRVDYPGQLDRFAARIEALA